MPIEAPKKPLDACDCAFLQRFTEGLEIVLLEAFIAITVAITQVEL